MRYLFSRFILAMVLVTGTAAATSLGDSSWSLLMRSPVGNINSTLHLQAASQTVTGRMIWATDAPTNIYEPSITGNRVTWKSDVNAPMPMTLTFSGTIEGDTMSGTVTAGALGSWPFSATRIGNAQQPTDKYGTF